MKSIRMCIVCKKRDYQKNLLRFQCKNGKIIKFSGVGRSFYICKECINSKKLIKLLANKCNKDKENIKEQIKQISFSILH
ncbi:DUF448 domain-containing protein [Caminibacter mediatlanticus]|nr:DUF448 domain-containing protein [Caminibacter mediatlanticus]EDM24616.1 hypothetical protein CMTB2_03833 [Caminibacter mediatlanticus TB-2]